MTWLTYAVLSAVAAAATTTLAKIGVESVSSNVATAVRTVVILGFALAIVTVRGEFRQVLTVSPRAMTFLILSGCTTGLSWLAYFRALQLGQASMVAPIDKLSLPLTVVLAALVLGESVSWRTFFGLTLMVIGAVVVTRP